MSKRQEASALALCDNEARRWATATVGNLALDLTTTGKLPRSRTVSGSCLTPARRWWAEVGVPFGGAFRRICHPSIQLPDRSARGAGTDVRVVRTRRCGGSCCRGSGCTGACRSGSRACGSRAGYHGAKAKPEPEGATSDACTQSRNFLRDDATLCSFGVVRPPTEGSMARPCRANLLDPDTRIHECSAQLRVRRVFL